MGWKIYQMYVKIVFLNSKLKEELYIEKLKEIVVHNKEANVCNFKKLCMDSSKLQECGIGVGAPRI